MIQFISPPPNLKSRCVQRLGRLRLQGFRFGDRAKGRLIGQDIAQYAKDWIPSWTKAWSRSTNSAFRPAVFSPSFFSSSLSSATCHAAERTKRLKKLNQTRRLTSFRGNEKEMKRKQEMNLLAQTPPSSWNIPGNRQNLVLFTAVIGSNVGCLEDEHLRSLCELSKTRIELSGTSTGTSKPHYLQYLSVPLQLQTWHPLAVTLLQAFFPGKKMALKRWQMNALTYTHSILF